MSDQLPQHVDAHRLAREGERVVGTLPVARLRRLESYLSDTAGSARAEIRFGIDGQGVMYVRGRAQASLTLLCQRCLEALRYPVQSEFCLGLAASEALGERLAEVYEPLIVEEGALDLWALIEDELILALPIVARHSPEECAAQLPRETAQQGREDTVNPFAALAELKSKRMLD